MISLHKATFASKLRLTRMQSEGEEYRTGLAFCNQGRLNANSMIIPTTPRTGSCVDHICETENSYMPSVLYFKNPK
jgi:hypothetical protein